VSNSEKISELVRSLDAILRQLDAMKMDIAAIRIAEAIDALSLSHQQENSQKVH